MSAAQAFAPKTTLASGAILTGTTHTNASGREVHIYRGIRYAETPKRWKQTTLKTLTGDIDATSFGSPCLSQRIPTGSEDCLFLNVYKPANATPEDKLPVMVWIHGGAFLHGSSNPYDGSNLVDVNDHKIVYVSFNYRLGVFGFLSNEAILAEGDGANFGLRDQEIAFQWVQQNITSFGGDPDNITAFGQSAGGISIGMHMVSRDGNQQLFHKAIAQSGAWLSMHDTASASKQAENTIAIASAVGCADSENVLESLRAADAHNILAAVEKRPIRPTVDYVFLRDAPNRLAQAGKISPVPTIVGTTTNEGWGYAAGVESEDQFEPYVRSVFPLLTEDEYTRASELYPLNQFETARHRAAEVFGDAVFVCPSESFSASLARKRVSDRSTSAFPPTYRYRFNQVSTAISGYPLAIHGDELPYLFSDARTALELPFLSNVQLPNDSASCQVVDAMQEFWLNFAVKGMPSGVAEWPEHEVESKQQLLMQSSPTIERTGKYVKLHNERFEFWNAVEERLATRLQS